MAKYYSKAKIIVGAPEGELKKYRVNFKVEPEGSGFIEAWTTGPVTVENGGEVAKRQYAQDGMPLQIHDLRIFSLDG